MNAVATEAALPQNVRMTLNRDEYLSEYGGRLLAGTVVVVDEKTARRWLDKDIARPSEETDKTLAEQKRAELARLKAELEALEAEGKSGNYASIVTREGGVPARRQG